MSTRRISALLLLAFLWKAPLLHAQNSKLSLLLVEYGKDSIGEQTQTLVRYHFEHGVMAGREDALTTKTLDLRYDLGGNSVYKGRYVVTRWGDVVDLSSKKLLFKSKGELLGIDEQANSVIVKVDRENDAGIYAFNLATGMYRPIQQPSRWAMPGTANPSRTRSATGEGSTIWLHDPRGHKVLLGRDFSREGTVYCSSMGAPVFEWLDDRHLVTQRGNGHLVIVDVNRNIQTLADIANVDPPACGPRIFIDASGHICYETRKETWSIDPVTRIVSPCLWISSGHDFDIGCDQPGASQGTVIRYKSSPIGQWWGHAPVTAPGHIAIAFGPVGSNLGYPAGVKVWSAESRTWTTITPKWLATLIGWAND